MDKQTPPIRPFCLEYAEAKNETFAAVNNIVSKHNIPFYLLENIVTELARQVAENAEVERRRAERDYQTQLAEYEKNNVRKSDDE